VKCLIPIVAATLLLSGVSSFMSSSPASAHTDTTWQWGSNTWNPNSNSLSPRRERHLAGVVHIDSSNGENIVVLGNGTVEDWGNDSYGDLGNGTVGHPSSVPVLVNKVNDVITTASGYNYVLALTKTGHIWAWGNDDAGNLCNGTTHTYDATPFKVQGVAAVKGIAAGGGTTVLLLDNGTVETCGANRYGQLGDGVTGGLSAKPVAVSGLSGVSAVSGADDYEAALTTAGKVYGWGADTWGQLGNGTTTNSDIPVKARGITNAKQIYAGGDAFINGQMMVEEAHHTVVGYGDGVDGQLCNGTFSSSDTPTPVKVPKGVKFDAVATGGRFSMFLDSTGGVWTCGFDNHGELGNGTVGVKTDLPGHVDSGADMISTTGPHALDHHP
jgi:alpha-tubulin suppressor-like RCC1 family protein